MGCCVLVDDLTLLIAGVSFNTGITKKAKSTLQGRLRDRKAGRHKKRTETKQDRNQNTEAEDPRHIHVPHNHQPHVVPFDRKGCLSTGFPGEASEESGSVKTATNTQPARKNGCHSGRYWQRSRTRCKHAQLGLEGCGSPRGCSTISRARRIRCEAAFGRARALVCRKSCRFSRRPTTSCCSACWPRWRSCCSGVHVGNGRCLELILAKTWARPNRDNNKTPTILGSTLL